MGSSRWDPAAWTSYAASASTKTREEIFTSSSIDEELDPKNIMMRESHDSDHNPASTPIIVAVDVTGSMGMLAEALVKKGLGPLFEEIIERKPVSDPHVMAMAVGDAWMDRAPLQVTQFEADLVIADQIEKIFIEGGGGGNQYESYNLPWYFAAMKTHTHSLEKRNKKGYLFTVGDEPCPPKLLASHVNEFIGGELTDDMTSESVLGMAERTYNVFHVVVEEGSYARRDRDGVMASWTPMLGQRVLPMKDHTKLSEIIVSAIQVNEGVSADSVISSWSGDTSLVVAKAISNMTVGDGGSAGGPVRL